MQMKSEHIGHKSARHCCFFTDLIKSVVDCILNYFIFHYSEHFSTKRKVLNLLGRPLLVLLFQNASNC